MGNKFYRAGTIAGQVFRRNPHDRDTTTLADSVPR